MRTAANQQYANHKRIGGDCVITSTITGSATFQFRHPDYVTQNVVVNLPDGEEVFAVNVALVHV